MTLQANLTNRDATRMPHPLVKWSYEPPRAEDVPHAIARATHLAHAAAARARCSCRSRWTTGRPRSTTAPSRTRPRATCRGRAAPGRRGRATLAGRLASARRARCWSPAPTSTPAGRVGRRGRARGAPAAAGVGDAGAGRRPDRLPRGPPAVPGRAAAGGRARWAQVARPHDLVLVAGVVGLPLLPQHPGPAAARGHDARGHHQRSRRGRRAPMGDAIVADVRADARGAAGRGRRVRPRAPPAAAGARAAGRDATR